MSLGLRRYIPWLVGGGCALVASRAEAERVVWVNTEPITVIDGDENDPSQDQIHVTAYNSTSFAGWNGASEAQRQALIHLLADATVYWDVVWTLERPAVGTYDMVVFGDQGDFTSAFGPGCSTQVGISDCGDVGGVSISFVFWGCLEPSKWLDPHRVAFAVLGALGYSWGLDNLSTPGQVMGGYTHAGLVYGDRCEPVAGQPNCAHELCPAGQQRSMADMVARHGARVDDGPPEIVVLEPQPDAIVSGPFEAAVEVLDDFGGVSAELAVQGLAAAPVLDDEWPFRWRDIQLPTGPQVLEITARDADHHRVTVTLPIVVTSAGDEGSDQGSDEGSDEGSDGDTSADAGEHDPPAGGFVPLQRQDATVSCACATTSASDLPVSLLSLVSLLGLAGFATRAASSRPSARSSSRRGPWSPHRTRTSRSRPCPRR